MSKVDNLKYKYEKLKEENESLKHDINTLNGMLLDAYNCLKGLYEQDLRDDTIEDIEVYLDDEGLLDDY